MSIFRVLSKMTSPGVLGRRFSPSAPQRVQTLRDIKFRQHQCRESR